VLPATRKEDTEFRQRLLAEPSAAAWEWLHDLQDDAGDVEDRLSIWPRETLTADGYRLWWFHSTRKAQRDEAARLKKIDRAIGALTELRRRMARTTACRLLAAPREFAEIQRHMCGKCD